jgi:diaminopimelate epimerase
MTIETGAGLVTAEVSEDDHVTLNLASPAQFKASMPLTIDGESVRGSYIRVGVPHYVIFVDDDLWERDIEPSGRKVRFHPALGSEGANVNFVSVRDRHSIAVRTYERGVEGETLSCGSGVVSSTAVSALLDRVESPVSILTRSGIELRVEFTRADGTLQGVRLSGDARVIYQSEIAPETLNGFDADWVRNPTEAVPQP